MATREEEGDKGGTFNNLNLLKASINSCSTNFSS
jgi:hypothetical protein